jgi:hypothetical protein
MVLADPLIIDVQCCCCVHGSDMEGLCDPNSISILIVHMWSGPLVYF